LRTDSFHRSGDISHGPVSTIRFQEEQSFEALGLQLVAALANDVHGAGEQALDDI